jgi:hypothetical protein
MSSKQQIIDAINAHMARYPNTKNPNWYVGIAADARERLFDDHSVDERNGIWIYQQADSSNVAREVESAYHDAGCKGGPGGGDKFTDKVYAYVITSTTKE